MIAKTFYHLVQAELEFSRQEIEHLISLASRHYDGVCRQAGLTGVLPSLVAMMDMAKKDLVEDSAFKADSICWIFSNRDVQTFCKITEMEGLVRTEIRLHWRLFQIVNAMEIESSKLREEARKIDL